MDETKIAGTYAGQVHKNVEFYGFEEDLPPQVTMHGRIAMFGYTGTPDEGYMRVRVSPQKAEQLRPGRRYDIVVSADQAATIHTE